MEEALGIDIGGVIIDRVMEDRLNAAPGDPAYASAVPMEGTDAALERRPERAAALTWRA